MPKITITEKDLTSPGSLQVSTNTVYVPGFSRRGPVGVPTLVETVAELEETFFDQVDGYVTYIVDDYCPAYPEVSSIIKDGEAERGYIFAKALLSEGIPVLFERLTDATPTVSCEEVYSALSSISFEALKDKGAYNIKFLTTGGYPTVGLLDTILDSTGDHVIEDEYCLGSSVAESLKDVAVARGDCVAILDHMPDVNPTDLYNNLFDTDKYYDASNKELTSSESCVKHTVGSFTRIVPVEESKYCALFSPWGTYRLPRAVYEVEVGNSVSTEYMMPASFGYLLALARGSKTSPSWYAMAGVQRGVVPYLVSTHTNVTNAIADMYQPRNGYSINPITRINPFGLVLWGNRTAYNNELKGNLTASSFLNIRNLISDVKKTVWTASRQMTFEQNNDVLWVTFKSLVTPTLDEMVSGGGLRSYELKRRTAKEKAALSAVVRLFAIEAVEDFEIEIQLADDSTVVTE